MHEYTSQFLTIKRKMSIKVNMILKCLFIVQPIFPGMVYLESSLVLCCFWHVVEANSGISVSSLTLLFEDQKDNGFKICCKK